VVVWTQGAVTSDWVYAEAVRAAAQRKVVTVRAADVDSNFRAKRLRFLRQCRAKDFAVFYLIRSKKRCRPAQWPLGQRRCS
jgi:hypothetical protein